LVGDGVTLYDGRQEGTFTNCYLQQLSSYAYVLEVENNRGLTNKVDKVFETTDASRPATPSSRLTFIGAFRASFEINTPCNTGGKPQAQYHYRLMDINNITIQESSIPCCSLVMYSLTPSTKYTLVLQLDDSEEYLLPFSTTSGIPSTPSLRILHATNSSLKVHLKQPVLDGSSFLHMNVIVERIVDAHIIDNKNLFCSARNFGLNYIYDCPAIVELYGLQTYNESNLGGSYRIGIRAFAEGGASDWHYQNLEADHGQVGMIQFESVTEVSQAGRELILIVHRTSGGNFFETVEFSIESMETSWNCAQDINNGAVCSENNNIAVDVCTLSFREGDYERRILINSTTSSHPFKPKNLTITLLSASVSLIDMRYTQARVAFQASPLVISFETTRDVVLSESSGQIAFRIVRSGGFDSAASVMVTSSVTSAIPTGQFQQLVQFERSEASVLIHAPIRRNDEFDLDRIFNLTLSSPSSGYNLQDDVRLVRVIDDDDISLPAYPKFQVERVSGGLIRLSWLPPQFRGGRNVHLSYIVRITSLDTGFFGEIADVQDQFVSISNLNSSTLYEIRMASTNIRGTGVFSKPLRIQTTIANDPSWFEVYYSAVTGGAILLRWKEPEDKGGVPLARYELYVSSTEDKGFAKTIGIDASSRQFKLGDLSMNTEYSFSLTAYNAMGYASPPSYLFATTSYVTSPEQPLPPILLNVTGGSLKLGIKTPTDSGGTPIQSFSVIYARLTGWEQKNTNSHTFSVESINSSGFIGYASLYNLLSNSDYTIQVLFHNRYMSSLWSEEVIFRTGPPSLPDALPKPYVESEEPGFITLSWDAPLETGGVMLTGYVVHGRRRFPNGTWSELTVVHDGRNSASRSAVIGDIQSLTWYGFRISSYNLRSLCSETEQETLGEELLLKSRDGSIPSSPRRLRVVHKTGGLITIAWDAPKSSGGEVITGYFVYAGIEDDIKEKIAYVPSTEQLYFAHYGLHVTTRYQYVVYAENARGIGAESYVLEVITTETTPPGPVKSLKQVSHQSGGTVLLSWLPPDDTGGSTVSSYFIYRNSTLVGQASGEGYTIIYRDSVDVTANTEYEYTVYPKNAVMMSVSPSYLVVRTGNATVAAAPSVYLIKKAGGFVEVQWAASLDSGGLPIRGFQVSLLKNSDIISSYLGLVTRHIFSGLFADLLYQLRVQTINDMGLGEPNLIEFHTGQAQVPDKAPQPKVHNVFGGRITLQVNAPDDFGGSPITGFKIFKDGFPADVVLKSPVEFDVLKLKALTKYSLTVIAVNDIGSGLESEPIVVTTTDISAPDFPTDLKVVHKDHESISLSWSDVKDTGGDSSITFDLEIKKDVKYLTVENVNPVLRIPDLHAGASYEIRIRSKNRFGPGDWSPVMIVETYRVSPGAFMFETDSVSVLEDGGDITINVLRTEGGLMVGKCRYRTVNGTALSGMHYQPKSDILVFNRGVTQLSIVIPIINNAILNDPDLYFTIVIEEYDEASGLIGSPNNCTVTIKDDGDAGKFGFEKQSYATLESSLIFSIRIVRFERFSGPSKLLIESEDLAGEAKRGIDFEIQTPTISFQDQQNDAAIIINIFNDKIYQIQKLIRLTLQVIEGRGSIGSNGNTFINIADDGDISAPWAPIELSLNSLSGGLISLAWRQPINPGGANISYLRYEVEVTSQDGYQTIITTFEKHIQVSGLHHLTEYAVTVSASNMFYIGLKSNPVFLRMGDVTAPTAPLNLEVTWRTGGAANITWTAPYDSGGAQMHFYRVYLSSKDNTSLVKQSRTESQALYGLLPLTDYTVQVQGMNFEGLFGAMSDPMKFTTRAATLPGKPEGVIVIKATGGAFYFDLPPPLDTGGLNISAYLLYVNSLQLPNVFSEVYRGTDRKASLYGLKYSSTYKVKYRVLTAVGLSDFSEAVAVSTNFLTLPTQPRNIAVSFVTGGSISLQWLPPLDFGGSPIKSYQVNYFRDYTSAIILQHVMNDIPLDTTRYVTTKIAGLMPNTTYGFMVIAVNDISACADASSFSNYSVVRGQTTSISVPEPPVNVAILKNTAGMQMIAWDAPDDTGGDSALTYLVYSETSDLLYNGSISEFSRYYLKANTTYSYQVVAMNSVGSSTRTMPLVRATSSRVVAPTAPVALSQIFQEGGAIGLSWKSPLDTGGDFILGYNIFRNGVILEQGHTLKTSTFTDVGLRANEQYIYNIQAVNKVGAGALSIPLRAQTGSVSLPEQPGNVVVRNDGGALFVSWVPPVNTGGAPLLSFTIRLSSADDSQTIIVDAKRISITYYGLHARENYFVSVSAVNEIGESSQVSQAFNSGEPMRPSAPPKPTLVSVNSTTATILLYLPINNGGVNVTKFIVYNNGDDKVMDFNSDIGGQIVLSNLFAATDYEFTYTVVTDPSLGESEQSYSLELSTGPTTPPSEIYDLEVIGRYSEAIALRWKGPDDNGGEYPLYEIEGLDVASNTVAKYVTATERESFIEGLNSSTSYYFHVRANNSAGVSKWSSNVYAMTDVARRGFLVFDPSDNVITENQGLFNLKVSRVNGSAGQISAIYSFDPDSSRAVENTDFRFADEGSQLLVFDEGEASQMISIEIMNNDQYEDYNKSIVLILKDTTSDRTDYVADQIGTINIVDDGDAGEIEFAEDSVIVKENANTLTLTLRRSNGNSTASTVKLSLDTELENTAEIEVDFRLPMTKSTFYDGEVEKNMTVYIKNNDNYEFPHKVFFLKLSVVTGGATIGTVSTIEILIEDDGDKSVPGHISGLSILQRTGGMLQIAWIPPINRGGEEIAILSYNVSVTTLNFTRYYQTEGASSNLSIGSLSSLTKYSVEVAAINELGQGGFSSPSLVATTSNYTQPGTPKNIRFLSSTGGILTLNITPPIDLGGANIDGYKVYVQDHVTGNFEVGYCVS
jgi:hypothetical protein